MNSGVVALVPEMWQAVRHGKEKAPKDSWFVGVNKKAAEKPAEMDRQTQAKAVATACPICKEEFEIRTERDLHMLDKHLPC